MAVAGDRTAVGTARVPLVDDVGLAVDTGVDTVLGSNPKGGPLRSTRRGSVLVEVSRVSNLGEIHWLNQRRRFDRFSRFSHLLKREKRDRYNTISDNNYSGVEDASGSALYLATRESDDPEVVSKRLRPISRTSEDIIDVLEEPPAR